MIKNTAKNRARTPPKIDVGCPHCGHRQRESPFAVSTICLGCAEHFTISAPVQPSKRTATARGGTGFWSEWLNKLAGGARERSIRCFQCSHPQRVSTSAKNTQCPKCSAYIELESFKISGPFSRAIRTQGTIKITSSGDLASSKVYCSGAVIQGNVRGNLICNGTVEIHRKGRIVGVIEADKVIVSRKSDIDFVRPLRVHDIEIAGRIRGDIFASGTVKICHKGFAEGNMVARGFNVEKGGVFRGELTIGQADLVQSDLFPAPASSPASGDSPQAPLAGFAGQTAI